MYKLTLLLIPILFFMTSCTIDWNDENTSFQKGKDCIDMTSEFNKLYNKGDSWWITWDKVWSVFFSKTLDTCIVTVDTWDLSEEVFDWISNTLIKYHNKPSLECSTEDRANGCLNWGNEYSKYIQEIKN